MTETLLQFLLELVFIIRWPLVVAGSVWSLAASAGVIVETWARVAEARLHSGGDNQ